MLEEQAKLETVRPGRSLFVRKVRLGDTTPTATSTSTSTSTPTSTAPSTSTTLQIVCVHGTCASEQQYHSMLESLHAMILAESPSEDDDDKDTNNIKKQNVSIQCLLPDMMGCGQSPPSILPNKGDSAYSNEEIMADLTTLMDTHLDPNLPVVIMGHSYACNVILPMLLENKKKPHSSFNLAACIFLSSAVRCPENPNPDGGHWMMSSPYVPDILLHYLQPSMTRAFCDMAVHPDHVALREQVAVASNGNNMRTARAYHRNHRWYVPNLSTTTTATTTTTTTTDASSLSLSNNSIADLNVPILMVHGADDVIIPVAAGRSLATSLSTISSTQQSEHASEESAAATSSKVVDFVTVERARHLVMMEQPEEVARAIWKFLRPLCV